eukprot:280901-Prymnesium_polylepis.1
MVRGRHARGRARARVSEETILVERGGRRAGADGARSGVPARETSSRCFARSRRLERSRRLRGVQSARVGRARARAETVAPWRVLKPSRRPRRRPFTCACALAGCSQVSSTDASRDSTADGEHGHDEVRPTRSVTGSMDTHLDPPPSPMAFGEPTPTLPTLNPRPRRHTLALGGARAAHDV